MGTIEALYADVNESRSAAVAANVRAVAARYGVKQADLAKALGIHQTAVSTRWRGVTKWGFDEVQTIADLFGVPFADLVAMPGETQSPDRWIAPSGAAARPKGLEPPTF